MALTLSVAAVSMIIDIFTAFAAAAAALLWVLHCFRQLHRLVRTCLMLVQSFTLCVCAFALVTSMKYAAGKGHFDWQAKYAHAHTVWTQQQKSIPRIAQFQSLLIRFVVGDRTNTFKSISFVQLCSSWCVCLPFFVCLRAHQTWWLKFGQKRQKQNGVEHQQHKKCTKSALLLWH